MKDAKGQENFLPDGVLEFQMGTEGAIRRPERDWKNTGQFWKVGIKPVKAGICINFPFNALHY